MLARGVPAPTLRSARPLASRPPRLALQFGELGTELLKLQAQDVRLLSDGPRLLGFVRGQWAGGLDLQQPPGLPPHPLDFGVELGGVRLHAAQEAIPFSVGLLVGGGPADREDEWEDRKIVLLLPYKWANGADRGPQWATANPRRQRAVPFQRTSLSPPCLYAD